MIIEGKKALVTGAGHRVGRALALALGSEGMHVAVHYNASAAPAHETVRLIESAGGKAIAFAADLSHSDAPETLVQHVVDSFGSLDVVINSAAIMERLRFGEVTVDQWDATMNINLRAPFFLCQAAAKVMNEGGAFINISDLAAFETWPEFVPHGISKAGVVKLTESLARLLAPGIRVNAIAPGAVLMPEGWDPDVVRKFAESTPLERIGDPQDVVMAMLYLLRADFVTGETIIVDGGRHVRK